MVAAVVASTVPGVGPGSGTANAAPGEHEVTYSVSSPIETIPMLYFMAKQPPSVTAYADNTPAFLYAIRPKLNPDMVWSTTVSMPNPDQWATVSAFNSFAEVNTPEDNPGVSANFRCDIAVDGRIVVSKQGEYRVECTLRDWEATRNQR